MRRLVTALLAGAAMALSLSIAQAADEGGWIGTWTASAQPAWASDFPVPLGAYTTRVCSVATRLKRMPVSRTRPKKSSCSAARNGRKPTHGFAMGS